MTTIPDDMIERVARTLREADIIWGARRYPEKSVKEIRDLVEDASDGLGYEGLARAAIEAMQPAILAERERCAAEIASLREQLAESDRNAEKLEALLEPHVSWEGEPPAAILAAEKRGEERERERLANMLDPEIGLPSDRLLRVIHADVETRGRKNNKFAVTVHHRNIVLSAVAAAIRKGPDK